MAQYTLEHGQRNLIPTLKTVQWGLGIGGWCADLLNMQKNGMWWARAAQPGFLLMCNIYRSYIGILLQEMWHAPIKETIAISVKYYTVFPFSFAHCLIGEFSPSSFWNTEAIWPSLKTTEHTVGTQHSWSCWTMLYERPNLPLPCYMNQNDLC